MYSSTITQFEDEPRKKTTYEEVVAEPIPLPAEPAEQPLIWRNIIALAILHVIAVWGFFKYCNQATLWTWIWHPAYGITSGYGVTAGAHRLWAHRSYSAKTPLRIFLAMLYCMTGQTCLSKWIRDHRTHHRYTETPADPHDANRGFFFSHIGWLMMRRHPAVKTHGSKVDMSDILADPVVRFADKYYTPIMLFLCFVFPTIVPVYMWGDSWTISVMAVIVRYVGLLNVTFSVNSFAHMWGNRPYNSAVKPTENPTVAFFTLGEGWHNYHHAFPWDYKASELGAYGLNPTSAFIELMAWVGLAYNLKTPSDKVIEKTSVKKGDGTISLWGNRHREKENHSHTIAEGYHAAARSR